MKQVKKVPKTQGYSNQLNDSVIEKTDEHKDVRNKNLEEDTIIKAFEFFDVNKRGYISCREYFSILLGTKEFKEEEIEKILEASNLTINGVVEYKKFYEFWKNK